MSRNPATSRRAGFSLIELLMAIFILGIGIISIASLFPAGIAQQRGAMDDQVGPLVARNAMSLLRSRIPADAFGYSEDSNSVSPWDIRPGDFPWLRPSVVTTTASGGGGPGLGSIDIFDALDNHPDFSSITTVGEKDTGELVYPPVNGTATWLGETTDGVELV